MVTQTKSKITKKGNMTNTNKLHNNIDIKIVLDKVKKKRKQSKAKKQSNKQKKELEEKLQKLELGLKELSNRKTIAQSITRMPLQTQIPQMPSLGATSNIAEVSNIINRVSESVLEAFEELTSELRAMGLNPEFIRLIEERARDATEKQSMGIEAEMPQNSRDLREDDNNSRGGAGDDLELEEIPMPNNARAVSPISISRPENPIPNIARPVSPMPMSRPENPIPNIARPVSPLPLPDDDGLSIGDLNSEISNISEAESIEQQFEQYYNNAKQEMEGYYTMMTKAVEYSKKDIEHMIAKNKDWMTMIDGASNREELQDKLSELETELVLLAGSGSDLSQSDIDANNEETRLHTEIMEEQEANRKRELRMQQQISSAIVFANNARISKRPDYQINVDAERGRRPSGSGDDSYDSDTSFVDGDDSDTSYVLSQLSRDTDEVPELSRGYNTTTERNTDLMWDLFDMFPSSGANTTTVAPGEIPPEWFVHRELPDIVRRIKILHPADFQDVIQTFMTQEIPNTATGRPQTIRAMDFKQFSELANNYIDFAVPRQSVESD